MIIHNPGTLPWTWKRLFQYGVLRRHAFSWKAHICRQWLLVAAVEIFNSCFFFIILIFYVLDGFHKRRRPNQGKANERSSCYCHDKGCFKRGCPDLLRKITLTKVSVVWIWILLQTNLLAWTPKKEQLHTIPAGICLFLPISILDTFFAKRTHLTKLRQIREEKAEKI